MSWMGCAEDIEMWKRTWLQYFQIFSHSVDGNRTGKQSNIQRRLRVLESEFIGSFRCYQDKGGQRDLSLQKKNKDKEFDFTK